MSSLKAVPNPDDDDLIGISGDGGLLLPEKEVDAICRSMKLVEFRMFKRMKYVLKFDVISPDCYLEDKVSLNMYLRFVKSWKRVPTASRLFKAACVAYGGRLRGQRITRSMFVGQVFRCRLRVVSERRVAYSIIDSLIEKLTSTGPENQ